MIFFTSLSNDSVKTKSCPLFLDDHDVQPCLLIIVPSTSFKNEIYDFI